MQTMAAKKTPKTFDPKKLKDIKPTYTVSLTVGDKTYTASSDDIAEAILALKPTKITSRTVFTLDYLGKTGTLMRPIGRAKRILANRLTAELTGRALLMMLK